MMPVRPTSTIWTALIEQAAAAVPEQPQTPAAQKKDDPLSADDIDALLEQASAGTQQNAAAPEAENAANGGGADDDAGAPDIGRSGRAYRAGCRSRAGAAADTRPHRKTMIRFPPTTSTPCWNRLPPERSRTRRLPKTEDAANGGGADGRCRCARHRRSGCAYRAGFRRCRRT